MEKTRAVVTEKVEFEDGNESVSTSHFGKFYLSGLSVKEQNEKFLNRISRQNFRVMMITHIDEGN